MNTKYHMWTPSSTTEAISRHAMELELLNIITLIDK